MAEIGKYRSTLYYMARELRLEVMEMRMRVDRLVDAARGLHPQ